MPPPKIITNIFILLSSAVLGCQKTFRRSMGSVCACSVLRCTPPGRSDFSVPECTPPVGVPHTDEPSSTPPVGGPHTDEPSSTPPSGRRGPATLHTGIWVMFLSSNNYNEESCNI